MHLRKLHEVKDAFFVSSREIGIHFGTEARVLDWMCDEIIECVDQDHCGRVSACDDGKSTICDDLQI